MEDQKIQLLHPRSKKAVRISTDKYEWLKSEILRFLCEYKEGTFSDMTRAIQQVLDDRKVLFDGSLTWYLEWVKLDLEARHIITPVPKTSPRKYVLSKG